MQPFLRTLTFGIVLALVVPVINLSAQASDPVIEGARREGKLVVYRNTAGTPERKNALESAFEKKYPFITVELATGTPAQVTSRFLSEYEKGTRSADAINQGQAALFDILQKPESLAKYVPKDSGWLGADLRDKDGRWASGSIVLNVIGYNTKLVPKAEAPKSYQDLLNPKWSGKIGAVVPTSAPGVPPVWKTMEKQFGEDFIRRLAAQKIKYYATDPETLSKLVAGEILILLNRPVGSMEASRLRGDPVDWVRMSDNTYLAQLGFYAMAANPPHPNAAKLWIDFAFSKEGQQASADGGAVVHMPGIRLSHPDLAIQRKRLIQLERVTDAERAAFLRSFSAKYAGLFP